MHLAQIQRWGAQGAHLFFGGGGNRACGCMPLHVPSADSAGESC